MVEVGGVCGDRPAFHWSAPAGDLGVLSSTAVNRALGSRFGVVRACEPLPWVEGLPRISIMMAQGALRIPGWTFLTPPDGTGVSVDPEVARIAAVAETVERYCGMAPADPTQLVRGCGRDLCDVAVPPNRFPRLSTRQYGRFSALGPLTEDRVVDWSWAISLTHQRSALVPAAFVYWSVGGRPPNDFSPEMVSSGFAAHVSLPNAALAGLCEVLERDALAIAWHNRLPLTPLDAGDTSVGELLSGSLAGCGLDYELFSIPTDGPFPVVMAVSWSEVSQPHAMVGVACRPDPVAAATKALYEVCQGLPRHRAGGSVRPRQFRELSDHADLYASPEGARLLRRHLVRSAERASLSDLRTVGAGAPESALTAGVDALAANGLEVLISELTTPDVAILGFRVVRVLVPGTVDMCADARFPPLGTPRLYELPVELGLRHRPLPERRLNRLPVPLA